MPALRRRETGLLWQANPGARRAYIIVTAMLYGEGAALTFGAPERTSGPSYRSINEAGGPHLLGAVLLVLAVLLTVAPRHSAGTARIGLICACGVHVLMAISFVTSALAAPNAGLLAPIFVSVIASWFVSQSVLYHLRRR